VKTSVVEYRRGKPQDQLVLDILAKQDPSTGKIRNLPIPRADARPQQSVLMDGKVMWFHDRVGGHHPHLAAAALVGPSLQRRRAVGQSLRRYNAALLARRRSRTRTASRSTPGSSSWFRKAPGATYGGIDYWIRKGPSTRSGPLLLDSGRELKSILLRDFRPQLGDAPGEALVIDQVDTTLVTKMTFSVTRTREILKRGSNGTLPATRRHSLHAAPGAEHGDRTRTELRLRVLARAEPAPTVSAPPSKARRSMSSTGSPRRWTPATRVHPWGRSNNRSGRSGGLSTTVQFANVAGLHAAREDYAFRPPRELASRT
jgi:hypothetical protein